MTETFQKLAKEYGIVSILNLFEKESEFTYDTSPVIDADGRLLGKMQMVHIPDYENFHEQCYYTPDTC
jgi:N-carbamoylputrescine amidase